MFCSVAGDTHMMISSIQVIVVKVRIHVFVFISLHDSVSFVNQVQI